MEKNIEAIIDKHKNGRDQQSRYPKGNIIITDKINISLDSNIQKIFNEYYNSLSWTSGDIVALLDFAAQHKNSLNTPSCSLKLADLKLRLVIKTGRPYSSEDAKLLEEARTHLQAIPELKPNTFWKNYSVQDHNLIYAKIHTLLNLTSNNSNIDWQTPLYFFSKTMSYFEKDDSADNTKKDILSFIIKHDCFDDLIECSSNFEKESGGVGSHLKSSFRNVFHKSPLSDDDFLICATALSVIPIITPFTATYLLTTLTTATVIGLANSATRYPISTEEQKQLFANLSRISGREDSDEQIALKKDALNAIFTFYPKQAPTFSRRSESSQKLVALLSDEKKPASEMFDHVVDYMVDLHKNNGKDLFLAINKALSKVCNQGLVSTVGSINSTGVNMGGGKGL